MSDKAPFPGLRSFTREEISLFFGRDDCVEAMIARLATSHFLAVIGASGTGKSSLVQAGLLSGLDMGLLPKVGARWRVVNFRPGGSPLRNLAQCLLSAERSDKVADPVQINVLRARLKREPLSLLDWFRRGRVPDGTNVLLLVDQFEELFRYESYEGREEAEAFVARLLETKNLRDLQGKSHLSVPIYVAITMRSEYLGACSLIDGLAEAINDGMFLTPRMTREQCRTAITGPAAVCGVKIDDILVNQVLNDLSGYAPWDGSDYEGQLDRIARRADQLPLLQYTLNRMWARSKELDGGGDIALDLIGYEAIGGVGGAINDHAEEIVKKLGDSYLPLIERVFRALTAGTKATEAVRRWQQFGKLVELCNGDEASVRTIVDAFRGPNCNFLVPDVSKPLEPDTIVDITHESLIRQWTRLREWLAEEAPAADTYRDIETRAKLWAKKQEGLLTMPYLAVITAWRDKLQPNKAWADRYGDSFQLAMDYLTASEAAEEKRLAAKKAGDRRRFRRLAIWATVMTVLLAVGVASPTLIAELKYALNQAVQNIAAAVKPPSSAPAKTGQITPNDDILKNIILASHDEPLNFAGVRMDSAFEEGFLKPIDLQTLNYFIRQGYPREMLFWLFTDSFQLSLPGSPSLGYRYSPPDDYGCSRLDPKHRCYIDWIHNAAFTGLTVEEKTGIGLNAKAVVFARFCFDPIQSQQAAATVAPALVQASNKDLDLQPSILFKSPLTCGSDSWDPTGAAGTPQPATLPLTFGQGGNPISFTIAPRSANGVFGFLGTLVKLQAQHISPSQYAYIPSDRKYAADPPVLETVHENPNLFTVVTLTGPQNPQAQCFVSTDVNGITYCVPVQATTTKRIFSILAQLIGIQTTH